MKDFHGLIVNGCIEHEIVEYVLPQFQLMAERVGHFLWEDQIDEDSKLSEIDEDDQIDENSQLSKLDEDDQTDENTQLFKLDKDDQTDENSQLSDLDKDDQTDEDSKLFELDEDDKNDRDSRLIKLAHLLLKIVLIAPLIKEVSTLVRDLEEKLRNKESTDETNCATLDLLENIKLLKEDLKHLYLKVPDSSQCCFPMSDGPFFMHLLQRHLDDLLDSNAYSIALIKEEIELMAYEAKDVIDLIIVRDNGLLHLIFSLPITIKKMKLIKEEVSDLHENVSKNRGLIIVNSPKKPVERKSLTTDKIIVGKTTLAYKVYNDKSVSSHFDLCAWCTVDQGYDEKKLLDKIFYQVSDSHSKLSENIDVVDKLRKQLIGKRYLIVLDDVWDTATWDELTRPFPNGTKGSRIILTTREKEVALHGKHYTAPLNLRLLRSEESWELLEKRAFGNESCPDDLLDVGKEIAENCKGLPLVADLIAGVIAWRETKRIVWLEVQNNVSSFILNSEVEVMKVIELSYDHLPHHLKPCLLYLARFPKDSPMIILALKDFWHAEGLVEQTETNSVEEVMKVGLDNLISSSLVTLFNEIEQYWFRKLDFLTELVDLTVDFERSNTNDSRSSAAINHPWDFHFPSSLKKLCLYDFPLTSDSLSTIARLPKLEELSLYDTIIHGEEWNMGEEDPFENLKLLKLNQVTLSKWEVEEESFPKLEKLKLRRCRKLEEIPPSFGDIYSLKIIKLVRSPQLEDSALNIKEYAEDMRGGDELQILGQKCNIRQYEIIEEA
uniref:Root-knot nematode resistance protein n=1 Tax=Solanum tuberosum TaxID=4113 RepID=M1BV00_SOLTU